MNGWLHPEDEPEMDFKWNVGVLSEKLLPHQHLLDNQEEIRNIDSAEPPPSPSVSEKLEHREEVGEISPPPPPAVFKKVQYVGFRCCLRPRRPGPSLVWLKLMDKLFLSNTKLLKANSVLRTEGFNSVAFLEVCRSISERYGPSKSIRDSD